MRLLGRVLLSRFLSGFTFTFWKETEQLITMKTVCELAHFLIFQITSNHLFEIVTIMMLTLWGKNLTYFTTVSFSGHSLYQAVLVNQREKLDNKYGQIMSSKKTFYDVKECFKQISKAHFIEIYIYNTASETFGSFIQNR